MRCDQADRGRRRRARSTAAWSNSAIADGGVQTTQIRTAWGGRAWRAGAFFEPPIVTCRKRRAGRITQMKASTLIEELQGLLREHGDLAVTCAFPSVEYSASSVGYVSEGPMPAWLAQPYNVRTRPTASW